MPDTIEFLLAVKLECMDVSTFVEVFTYEFGDPQ